MGAGVVNCTCEAATSGFSILEVFLSSFLAFLSALAVEALWEWHKTTSLRKQLKKTLAEELKNLKEALAVIKDDEIYINPYSIPVWTGASKSGSILCLDKDKDFNEILKFFSLVEEANMIEMKAYEILNINPSANKTAILQNVIESRAQLKNEIDTIISVLKR